MSILTRPILEINLDNLTENYVGANFANYDYYVVLSHFKGHSMAGYGGAIKNISIGIAFSSDNKPCSWLLNQQISHMPKPEDQGT